MRCTSYTCISRSSFKRVSIIPERKGLELGGFFFFFSFLFRGVHWYLPNAVSEVKVGSFSFLLSFPLFYFRMLLDRSTE